jgi:hypothetical protein
MSLFTLGNINFSSGENIKGPLDALAGSKYGLNTFKYPEDLGNSDKGHYMVIYINEQIKTQFAGAPSGDEPTILSNSKKLADLYGPTNLTQGLASVATAAGGISGFKQLYSSLVGGIKQGAAAIDNLNGVTDTAGVAGGLLTYAEDSVNALKNSKGLLGVRTIRRITDTVALYMPDSLVFNSDQSYSTPHTSGVLGAAIAGLSSLVQAKNEKGANFNSETVVKNLTPFFASAVAQKTDTGKVIFSAVTGTVQNPMMEILYSSPEFRKFSFDFMFYPRSEKESKQVQDLIARLKFHQSPEILRNSGGFFLVPPSEFDIKFMYNGKENPNIPKVSTCVLNSISVNYAPNGFSAYETPSETFPSLGRTGMPVAIQMSLGFTETQYLTKDYYATSDIQLFQDTGAGTTTNSFGQTINNDYAKGI